MPFLFLVFFWDTYDSNVGVFNIVPEVSEIVFISFNSFFLFSSLLHLLPPFYLSPHLFSLLPQFFYCWFPPECISSPLLYCSLLIDSSLFLLSPCWAFLASSQSLSLFIYNSILFSWFWIIFTIIILNSFLGRLPISSSLVWFCGFLSCSFISRIFTCLVILFRLLCLGWPFCRLEVHGSS